MTFKCQALYNVADSLITNRNRGKFNVYNMNISYLLTFLKKNVYKTIIIKSWTKNQITFINLIQYVLSTIKHIPKDLKLYSEILLKLCPLHGHLLIGGHKLYQITM